MNRRLDVASVLCDTCASVPTSVREAAARALFEHEVAEHPTMYHGWTWSSPQVHDTGAHDLWLDRVDVVMHALHTTRGGGRG